MQVHVEPAVPVDDIEERDREPSCTDRVRSQIDRRPVRIGKPHDHFAVLERLEAQRAHDVMNSLFLECFYRRTIIDKGSVRDVFGASGERHLMIFLVWSNGPRS